MELCCSAVANALASEVPILLNVRSREVRDGSFERSRDRDCSSLEEEEEEAAILFGGEEISFELTKKEEKEKNKYSSAFKLNQT